MFDIQRKNFRALQTHFLSKSITNTCNCFYLISTIDFVFVCWNNICYLYDLEEPKREQWHLWGCNEWINYNFFFLNRTHNKINRFFFLNCTFPLASGFDSNGWCVILCIQNKNPRRMDFQWNSTHVGHCSSH